MSAAVLTHLRRPIVRASRPVFALGPVCLLASVVALAHLISGALDSEYWVDEVYMLSVGRNHLDWGYADQPPLVPLLAALMDWLAPASTLVLRLPVIAATTATVVLVALLAWELGGDRRAQMLAAGAYATALWPTLTGHWLTTYSIEPLQWTLLIWLLVRWIRLRQDWLLLALGAVAGLATQTKFQVFLLCAVLAGCAFVCGPRDLLRRPMLWCGAGIALLMAAPTLWWQATHGWPQLAMGKVVAGESPVVGGRLGTAVSLISLVGFVGVPLLAYGLWRLLSSWQLRAYRFIGVAFLLLYLFFVITAGRPYYLTGLYGMLLAAGAVGLQRRREIRIARWSWIAWPAYALSAAITFPALWAADEPKVMPGIPASEAMVQQVAEVHRALPPMTRSETAVFGESYIVTAYLDAYAPRYELPIAHSTHRGYGYFAPPPEQARTVIYVGPNVDELRPYFTEITKVRHGATPIWLCAGRTSPWEEFWPRLRHL